MGRQLLLAQKTIFQSTDWTWGSLCVLPVMCVHVHGFPPGARNEQREIYGCMIECRQNLLLMLQNVNCFKFGCSRKSISCVEQKPNQKVDRDTKSKRQIHKSPGFHARKFKQIASKTACPDPSHDQVTLAQFCTPDSSDVAFLSILHLHVAFAKKFINKKLYGYNTKGGGDYYNLQLRSNHCRSDVLFFSQKKMKLTGQHSKSFWEFRVPTMAETKWEETKRRLHSLREVKVPHITAGQVIHHL